MMRFPALLSRIALLACALLAAATPARADVKALLLATDYAEAADSRLQLDNPVADGRMIAAALRRTTVDEIELVEEPDAARWGTAFEDFAASLSGDDIAFVYFAGHGFQIDGANYLLAADGHSLIGLDAMLRRLTGEARGVVFVVDACRNNPLIEADRSTEMEIVAVEGAQRALDTVTLDDIAFSNRGLAQVGSLRGLSAVVFFSTEPGNVAEDGTTAGKGSPFAIEFAREIRRRQSLDETFRKTAVAVNERTSGRQSPWRQGDLPFDVFIGGMRALPIP
ncbi:caspase family protein [Qipengyuania flava]|uniref:caspase family protein n=1 Tax=Qipengyuania flava TaxID=192812 RepID=UPI003BAF319F